MDVSPSSSSAPPDAVSDLLPVLRVSRLLQDPLHHRREGQAHPGHGVSCVQRAGHQRPRAAGQLLLHAGHPGELTETRDKQQLKQMFKAIWFVVWCYNAAYHHVALFVFQPLFNSLKPAEGSVEFSSVKRMNDINDLLTCVIPAAAGLPGGRRLRALPQEADGARSDEGPKVPVVLPRESFAPLFSRLLQLGDTIRQRVERFLSAAPEPRIPELVPIIEMS